MHGGNGTRPPVGQARTGRGEWSRTPPLIPSRFASLFFSRLTACAPKGIILSSFFGGYIFTQVIGGHLADRYGGDSIQWMAALVWSLATLSMAFVAHVSVTMVLLVRFVTGLAQGRLMAWKCLVYHMPIHVHIHTCTHMHTQIHLHIHIYMFLQGYTILPS